MRGRKISSPPQFGVRALGPTRDVLGHLATRPRLGVLRAAWTQFRSHNNTSFVVFTHHFSPPSFCVEVDNIAFMPGWYPVVTILYERQTDATITIVSIVTAHALLHPSKRKLC